MGRITVFTGNDVNSKLVLAELERRRLPYAEIAVDESRLRDVQALCEVPSVPQVFFNTRHVGGVDAVRRELRHLWDKTSRYRTPLEKYTAEIAGNFDPTNERFALQEKTPKTISSHAALSVLSPTSIALPDGTTTSYRDITEKLKNTLPTVEVRRNGVLHHHIFTGMAAIKIFTSSLGISKEKAIAFGTELLRAQVIQPLLQWNNGSKSKTTKPSLQFLADDKAHYRLQCFHQPAILNSYCIWKGQFPTTKPAKLVSDMIFLLNDIETAAMNDRGQVDYQKARQHALYPLLEESVCELQKISPVDLPPSQKQKLSMALNIYQLMLRYAYFKVGIPLSESDRLKFLATLQFNICGTCYSFDDWYHVVLGRPKKGKPGLGIHEADQRAILAMHTGAVGGSKHSLPFGVFCIDDDAVIDAQLEIAAMVFSGDDNNVSVRKKGDVVMLSNVFKLKRSDFNGVATDKDLIENAVLPYANGKKKLQFKALLQSRSFQKITYTEPTLGRHTNNSLWFDEQALEVDEKGLRGMLKRFRPPKLHKNERARLATLRGLNVLDTLEEERYDRIVRINTHMRCGGTLPIGYLTFEFSIMFIPRHEWSSLPLTCLLCLYPW